MVEWDRWICEIGIQDSTYLHQVTLPPGEVEPSSITLGRRQYTYLKLSALHCLRRFLGQHCERQIQSRASQGVRGAQTGASESWLGFSSLL